MAGLLAEVSRYVKGDNKGKQFSEDKREFYGYLLTSEGTASPSRNALLPARPRPDKVDITQGAARVWTRMTIP